MEKRRILIVDDQEEIIVSLRDVLVDEGHEVIAARDGQEALHVVQNDSPDVVFLDIWIPGIDGMQTLKAIKKIDPGCAVIMMSGHGTIETAVKAIKLGATDYLEKPLNLEDVLHLVSNSSATRIEGERQAGEAPLQPRQLVGDSDRADILRRSVEKAAKESGHVWLVGEKGTGKEFLARTIHQACGKDRSSLIKLRCQDLNHDNLVEELFGKENGSQRPRPGKLLEAAGGSLLLVRVDRLEGDLRPKLADLLNDHLARESKSRTSSRKRIRILSTSTRDPETLVKERAFPRELADLLAQRIIRLPTLRERLEDIPLFVSHFLQEAAEEFDRDITGIDEQAMERLVSYQWPGNVKELKILIEHVVMTAPGPRITFHDLLIPGKTEDQPMESPGRARIEISDPEQTEHRPHQTHRSGWICSLEGADGNSLVPDPPFRRQKTLRSKVVVYGHGLHSGTKTGLTLSPLPPCAGILFGHITSEGNVPAILHNVESTEFSTSLRSNGSLARTIEHLMAVFHVYGLTNVLVKISGEVPIMDGSATEFCRMVESAEIITQDALIEEIRIADPIELPLPPDGPKNMRVLPSDRLEIEYHMDYPPPVGKMDMLFPCGTTDQFKEQIAPARTFGFVKDMRMMDEMGLAGGGRLSNVVLLDDEKVVNPPLRFQDEFVRHKILDIIGDFYLLGRPFIGKIVATQTGHTENIAMMRLIDEKLKVL